MTDVTGNKSMENWRCSDFMTKNTFLESLVTGFTPIAPKSCKYVGSKSHSITQHLWYLYICFSGIQNRETLTLTEGFWIELVLSWDVDLGDRSHIGGNFPCPVEICLMLALFSNNELTYGLHRFEMIYCVKREARVQTNNKVKLQTTKKSELDKQFLRCHP